jgi:hypothetical protein
MIATMKIDYQDPTILIPVGIILIGLALFFWALGKLLKKSTGSGLPGDDLLTSPAGSDPLPPLPDLNAPSVSSFDFKPPARESAPSAVVPNREISERLENMNQRLADMQTVLQRQATTAAPGTPLSPETIDKLLKIIGNVTQQVDVLQKSLGITPSSAPAASAPPPSQAPAAPSANPPAAGKRFGVLGGALSAFPKTGPGQAPPGGNPPGK